MGFKTRRCLRCRNEANAATATRLEHSETQGEPTNMDEYTPTSSGGIPRFEPITNDDAVQEAGRMTTGTERVLRVALNNC